MPENPKIVELLRKLKALADDAGASEAEAMAAAQKARELADRYGIDLGTIDLEEGAVPLSRRRLRPIDDLWPVVAAFCHCAMLFTKDDELKAVYIGQPHDVALALWLHRMLQRAISTALEEFKATEPYRRRKPHRRRAAAAAFVQGMTKSLARKLFAETDFGAAHPKLGAADAYKEGRYPDRTEAKIPSALKDQHLRAAAESGYQAGRAVLISTPIGESTAAPALLKGW